MTVEIIAEAGINHGGSLVSAMRLAEEARQAGADVVKYQTYQVSKLLHRSDPSWDLLAGCQLPPEGWKKLARHCENIGIEFMSTPGDVDSLKFLVEELGVRRIKIGSDDMTYRPLVEAARDTGLPLIVSTGMADSDEVRQLVGHLGRWTADLTLMQCTSLYPCPLDRVNLRAMSELRRLALRVGYSDHTQGTVAAVAAVALGAEVIEKHIMLHESNMSIDHEVSLFPHVFAQMVRDIRATEFLLGNEFLHRSPEELAMAKKVRKDPRTGLRPLL